MSFNPVPDPTPGDAASCAAVELVIVPSARDLGGFEVRRALPSPKRQMVGPFIFFDEMGPALFDAGHGIDVRPHPHIGLATVTYLFEGEITHRDSLGTDQPIRPGAVNWMTAGRGIVHSERTGAEERRRSSRAHGIQTWVALPRAAEETDPSFSHHAAGSLPVLTGEGKRVTLIAGQGFGERAAVRTFSDTLYAEAVLESGAKLPVPREHEERALYVVEGTIAVNGDRFTPHQLLVLRPGDEITVVAEGAARLLLFGGAGMDGPRHVWWNFVSSSRERIEQAKAEWTAGRFDTVPGDAEEFIPLPEQPGVTHVP